MSSASSTRFLDVPAASRPTRAVTPAPCRSAPGSMKVRPPATPDTRSARTRPGSCDIDDYAQHAPARKCSLLVFPTLTTAVAPPAPLGGNADNSAGGLKPEPPDGIAIPSEDLVSFLYEAANLLAPIENRDALDILFDYMRGCDRGIIEPRRSALGACVQFALVLRPQDGETLKDVEKRRDEIFEKFKVMASRDFQVSRGGETTIEIQIKGVNKSVPIYFLGRHFTSVLDDLGYQPGPKLDARKSKTIIVADGDGTLYPKQEAWKKYGADPKVGPGLQQSVAYHSILQYLESGGILAVNTGNDLERTRKRIWDALPESSRNELLGRILIIANAGATFTHFRADGTLLPISGYNNQTAFQRFMGPGAVSRTLDIVYLGDDAKPTGNDYNGFFAVGGPNAVCFSSQVRSAIQRWLKRNLIPGNEVGCDRFFCAVNSAVQLRDGADESPLFTRDNITRFVANARAQGTTSAS